MRAVQKPEERILDRRQRREIASPGQGDDRYLDHILAVAPQRIQGQGTAALLPGHANERRERVPPVAGRTGVSAVGAPAGQLRIVRSVETERIPRVQKQPVQVAPVVGCAVEKHCCLHASTIRRSRDVSDDIPAKIRTCAVTGDGAMSNEQRAMSTLRVHDVFGGREATQDSGLRTQDSALRTR